MPGIGEFLANRFNARSCFDALYLKAAEHMRENASVQFAMARARQLSGTGSDESMREPEVHLDKLGPDLPEMNLNFDHRVDEPGQTAPYSFPPTLIDALRNARHVLVFTGAGVSAESGIPTFRDKLTGVWERFSPTDLSTLEAFRRDPPLVWGWHELQRTTAFHAQPNPAHAVIAALACQVAKLTLITQNVDALHERAGSQAVIHLHGSLQCPRCIDCGEPYPDLPVPLVPLEGPRLSPPHCPNCTGVIRPGVVWFGEPLQEEALDEAFAAAVDCDVLLSIGTSGVVYPAAEIPSFAWQAGAVVVHVNQQPIKVRDLREYSLIGKAGKLLPELLSVAFPRSVER